MRMTRPCAECQTTMRLQKSALSFDREGFQIRVEGLWVYACPNGHESIPGPIAMQVMNLVDQVFRSAKSLREAVDLPSPVISVLFPTPETEPALRQPALAYA